MKKPLYTIVDVKKTCNELLQTTFPNITVYGNGAFIESMFCPDFFFLFPYRNAGTSTLTSGIMVK